MYEYLDRRYALALYEIAESKGRVEEYLSDLREVVNVIKTNSEFYQVIKHPQISSTRKKELFKSIFKDAIDQELLTFLLVLIDKDRILYLEEKLNEMQKIHLERNNTLLAVVKTVIQLEEEQRNTLKNKLERIYDKKVIINEEIDKTIIGGVYVRIGNDVIDGTIKSKLEEMKELMLKKD